MTTRSVKRVLVLSAVLLAFLGSYVPPAQGQDDSPAAKYVILLISDGWGIKHIEATNDYAGQAPSYQEWAQYWMSHYPAGGGYDPARAWVDFDYVKGGATDSAASATALYSGFKTSRHRIGASTGGERLYTIGDKARGLGKAVGAVSSVYVSDATPGGWYAHNDDRTNRYAIADEGFFGDPDTTGGHAGDLGPTWPPAQVIIGGKTADYVSDAIRDKLFTESGQPRKHTLVERISGRPDGGPRLLAAANDPDVTMLVGLFACVYRLADGSGYRPENPTLAESVIAALTVLNRNPSGFVLLVEGGAVDWAGHNNDMDRMIGELIGFDRAVQAVIDWVGEPGNGSDWENALVIVTGDHETGYLTAGPGVFPDRPLGQVDASTLAKEKTIASSGRRASWDDLDGDDEIDEGESVHWAWNSGGHTNNLIPLYARGIGSDQFGRYATGSDPVRGAYLDNTDVFRVMDAVLTARGNVALSITKAVAPGTGVAYHGPVTYTVVLANSGESDATGVQLTDTLPVSTTFGVWVERPTGASVFGRDITWRGTVTAGEAITLAFVARHTGDYGDRVSNMALYDHAGHMGGATATFRVRGQIGHHLYLPLIVAAGGVRTAGAQDETERRTG